MSQELDQNVKFVHTRSKQFSQRAKVANINTLINKKNPVNAIHGNLYQSKLLILFLYRGLSRNYSFELGTEIEEAKKFDDLTFKYTQNGKIIYCLLQAKHKVDESKKISATDLLNENSSDYSLMKYFLSYRESKKEKLFEDGLIKDVIICTNINFNFENLAKSNITVEKIKNEDDILYVKSNRKECAHYRFSKNIISLLKSKWESITCTDNEIEEFLNHLVFAVDQPNEDQLGNIIEKEMGREFNSTKAKTVFNNLFVKILDWLKGTTKHKFISSEQAKKLLREAQQIIPIKFNIKDPVKSFIGRAKQIDSLHNLLQSKDTNETLQFVSITGLGGIGKSELVKKYISQYRQEYNERIIWINAESYKTLVHSFVTLASDKLGISTINADNKEKEMHSIVQDVYEFFSEGKSLFVFDNVEKFRSENDFDSGINKFLPSSSLGTYILVTSRNKKWPRYVQVLELDVFSEEEAIEFIKAELNIKNDMQKASIEEMARQLQYFPLALQQAVTYIIVEDEELRNIGSEFTIISYLNKYKEQAQQILDFRFPENSDNTYTKTTFVTWNITLDTIKQKENGDLALKILNIVGYLAPADIPIELFLRLVNDLKKVSSAIGLLKQYSMINTEHGMFNIHKLVQEVIRIKLKEQNREEEVLKEALKLLNDNAVNSKTVNHAISVWNYLYKYEILIMEFLYFSSYISVELLESARYNEAYVFCQELLKFLDRLSQYNEIIKECRLITEGHISMIFLHQGKYELTVERLQMSVHKFEDFFGLNHFHTLTAKNNLVLALYKQGKYDEAKKLCQEVDNIIKGIIENNNFYLKNIWNEYNIAVIDVTQGKYNEALEVLQDTYKIQKFALGEVDDVTLSTKICIACVFAHQGKHDVALEMIEEVYNIWKGVLRKDHPKILDLKINKAGIFLFQDKYNDALKLYQEVNNIQKNVLSEDNPEILNTCRHIAEILSLQGKCNEALKMQQDILKKSKDTLGPDHPNTLCTQYSIARILLTQEKYVNVSEICEEILSKGKGTLENTHPLITATRNLKATAYSEQGKYDEAIQLLQEVFEIRKCSLGENHADTLCTKNGIGLALVGKKQYKEAQNIFQEILKTYQARFSNNHSMVVNVKSNIALVFCHRQKYDEALKLYKEVLDIQEATLEKECYNVLQTKSSIAAIFYYQRKYKEALELYFDVYKSYCEILEPESRTVLSIRQGIRTILVHSINTNNVEQVRYIFEKCVGVNAKNFSDIELLHNAVSIGNSDVVNILLENGANPVAIGIDGNTLLHVATSKGFGGVVEVLLQYVNRANSSDFVNARITASGATSLHIAVRNGYLGIVKTLLKNGAMYDIRNKEGKTPFNLSTDQNISNLLKLIDKLFKDAKNGNVKIIKKIRALQFDEMKIVTNVCNDQKMTLLQTVIIHKHMNIANKLLEMLKASNNNV